MLHLKFFLSSRSSALELNQLSLTSLFSVLTLSLRCCWFWWFFFNSHNVGPKNVPVGKLALERALIQEAQLSASFSNLPSSKPHFFPRDLHLECQASSFCRRLWRNREFILWEYFFPALSLAFLIFNCSCTVWTMTHKHLVYLKGTTWFSTWSLPEN